MKRKMRNDSHEEKKTEEHKLTKPSVKSKKTEKKAEKTN